MLIYLFYLLKEIPLSNVFLALEPPEIYTRFISEKGGHSARKKLLTLLSLLEHNVYHHCDNFSEENEMC